ncbi:helix-turn-helix domain-containing protein [Pseudarthrobacter sp. NPDC092439]|uniref:helix-turn-helix domain-containing protein n=1 Tax=unclassified Pseudarthrobacter TaxID=2647000 RepID=UPI00380B609F
MATSPAVGTIRDIAKTYRVSDSTIRRRIREGVLPVYRLGAHTIRVAYADAARVFAGSGVAA